MTSKWKEAGMDLAEIRKGFWQEEGIEMTLTKAELAELLCEKMGFNKREAKDIVDSFFEELRLALENGESIKLSSFGNFELLNKVQRPGRNPKTGEQALISARRVVAFHPSQKLKEMIVPGNIRP